MKTATELKTDELVEIVDRVQGLMYLCYRPDDYTECWNPEKYKLHYEHDMLTDIRRILERYDLAPETERNV